jgi:polar amino acid transport system substrate-binding protein
MNLHFRLGAFLLLPLLLPLASCSTSDTTGKLVLVSGVDPEHLYLRKQIRFLEEVLKSLNYELEVQKHQSAECFELSNSGQVDGEMWRIRGVDAEYKNLVRIPVSLWSHPELAFVKKDIELKGWESLAPYRVAFRAGTKVVENNIKGIVEKQVPLDTIDEAFRRLAIGEVDVVVSDNIVGTLLLESEKFQGSGIRVIEKPLDSALLFTYLHKKHSHLVPRLAKAIALAKRDGTYQRIVGEPPVDESPLD